MKGEDAAGGKQSKERLTVALCSSMTCGKIKPLVIGKSCQGSADWDLPARELLVECAPSCTASDSDNSDSESMESQAPPSLDRAQECIQELRPFALHTGNMNLQDMSVTLRMNSSLKQCKINIFCVIRSI